MPTLAIAAPVRGAFKRAKEAMRDPQVRLREALNKIQQLRCRLSEIKAELQKHSRRFADYTEQCRQKFETSKSFADEYAYRVARIVEKDHRESVSPVEKARLIYGLNVTGRTLQDEAHAKLATEVPDWRQPFTDAIKAKVVVSKRSYEDTLAIVRGQLSTFGEEAVTNDPRLKSAKYELARAESLQEQFRDGEGLKAWQIGISSLIE